MSTYRSRTLISTMCFFCVVGSFFSQNAAAKAYCLQLGSGANIGYFKLNAKPVKKTWQSTPIHGVFYASIAGTTFAAPIDGVATFGVGGLRSVNINVNLFSATDLPSSTITSVNADDKLAGEYRADYDNDGIPDSSASISAISCKNLPSM